MEAHAMICTSRAECNFWELVIPFYNVDPRENARSYYVYFTILSSELSQNLISSISKNGSMTGKW